MEVNQAIFGEGRDRGHTLLNSSFSTDSIPNQISGYTDLVDRPPDGELSGPIIRGLLVKDNFLLIKSFPDSTGRRGRVFSHALILKKSDYLQIKDITQLLPFLLDSADKQAEMRVIDYQNQGPVKAKPSKRVHFAVGGIIKHLEYENTIAWVGEKDYWTWISQIWQQLPGPVKSNIRIGAAFNAQRINNSLLNLVYIPDEIKSNWLKRKFLIVDEAPKDIPETRLNEFLSGALHEKDHLTLLLSELKPEIIEIDDLRIFEKYAYLYDQIEANPSFKELLILADLVSKYNASSKSAIAGKIKIINAIAKGVTTASVEEIGFLQHQTWQGFDEEVIDKVLGLKLKDWLMKHLLTGGPSIDKAKIAVTALSSGKRSWWHKFVADFIQRSLKGWKPSYSASVWSWCKADLSAAKIILSELPDNIEEDLVVDLPPLDKVSQAAIIEVALEKKWFKLFGRIAIKLYPSKEAFSRLFKVAGSKKLSPIIESMSTEIDDQQLITDAADLNKPPLTEIAVKRITVKPSLKRNMKISQDGWQQIWLQSVAKGTDLWKGIPQPKIILFQIMDHLADGYSFNISLLNGISVSTINSLKDHKQRASLWEILPESCRMAFVSATLADCLSDVSAGKLKIADLEQPLLIGLESPAIIRKIITDAGLSVKLKLQLFSLSPKFTEAEGQLLLEQNSFFNEDAIQFGNLTFSKGWRNVASCMFRVRRFRSDIEPALKQCYNLLGFFDRLSLYTSGYGSKVVSDDELWNTLLDKAILHYPEGPNQNGLWENAGGKRADLHTKGSGKEIWANAISHIKRGGKPSRKKLLEEMIEEFPLDESLKQLKQII